MAKHYRIELDEDDLGQVLDGLEIRASSWRRTAEYMRTGEMSEGEFFIIEECGDSEEANGIVSHYESILENIQKQMEAKE